MHINNNTYALKIDSKNKYIFNLNIYLPTKFQLQIVK